ncbi:MAG: hypothetical protein GC160_10455 [Acidobacteria bacterium]|nr:hypothetical protein [Acidobacteriota bacterium]
MQTKLTFFKSYYRMGWWAARVPMASEWGEQRIDQLGFGTTQTQAERDLVRQEQARHFEASASEIAA